MWFGLHVFPCDYLLINWGCGYPAVMGPSEYMEELAEGYGGRYDDEVLAHNVRDLGRT